VASGDAGRRIGPVAEALDRLTEEVRSFHADLNRSGFRVTFPPDGVAAHAVETLDATLATARNIERRMEEASSRPILGIFSIAGVEGELTRLAASIDRCRDALRDVRRSVIR
jgi:hypothetical protein